MDNENGWVGYTFYYTHKHMWRPTLLSKMIINILFLHKWFFVLKCASSLLFINVFYQAFERHILHCFCHHYWSYFNNLFAYYSTFILKQIFSHLLLQSLLSCRLIVSIFQMLQYFFYSKMPTIEETFCFQQCQSNMHNGTEIEEKNASELVEWKIRFENLISSLFSGEEKRGFCPCNEMTFSDGNTWLLLVVLLRRGLSAG